MKKIITFIILLFFVVIPVKADNLGHNSTGYERNESNNYGVNKDYKVNESNLEYVLRTPYVDANNKIYDFVDILTPEEENELKSIIDGFINETGLDFVFVSIDMPYTRDLDNDEYAEDFYDFNDYGINNKKYGGFILVRNNYENDPYYTISLMGEAKLYCPNLDQLLSNIYEYFPSKRYKEAIVQTLHIFKGYYDKGYDEERYYLDENGDLKENKPLNFLPSAISGGIVSLLTMLGLVKKNKMVKKASNANLYLDETTVEYTDKSDVMVSTITTHHRISSDSGSGGSSHSSIGHSGGSHISGGRHG